ncbi:response regulator [Anaerocolumna xylanovorans]|uniref:Stage 0 sporulation protein A homolog n=1 Tax=Anaerocolumna xylanovorans DSM 12503 TaxID=1121345 RepID=A0A1M7XZ48_9FIRM|nr:response regulator [Anaerocolumna xylanovorans]SHO44442.1 two-component system, response regulator YesN [Anaerocolumna xylanovorans DSM 12503]
MYRILIADDEKDERDAICFLLQKYRFPLTVTLAVNGKEALEHLNKQEADILFTDIKMPFLSGIELAGKARELYPDIQIVFFSGYDDFEYVKEALSLRAVNYILKPVNPEEFQKTILAVVESIMQKKQETLMQKASLNFMRNHILYQLINNTSLESIKKSYPSIDLSFLFSYRQMLLIQYEADFFGGRLTEDAPEDFSINIRSVLAQAAGYINLNPSQSLLLFTEALKETEIKNALERLHKYLMDQYKQLCYLAVSKSFSSPADMAEVFRETENYLEQRFFFPGKYLYTQISDSYSNVDPAEDDIILKSIEKDIQLKDIYSLKQNISLLIQKYENQATFSHIYVRYLFTSLLQTLLQNLPHYEEASFWQISEQIYHFRYFSDIRLLIMETLDKVAARIEQEQQSPRHAINLVDKYIRGHYGEELSLNILADKVYLTPRYLSSLFIQETGFGINKYIKNIRMEKAKELLVKTNMKISDICQEVGYSNVSYFCKSFQEDFGTTPDKFRQSHR